MRLIVFEDASWAEFAAREIFCLIQKLNEKDCINIVLTGGRGAAKIYPFLKNYLASDNSLISFYFGDERCVPSDHEDSNYALSMKTLFVEGLAPNHVINIMYNGEEDYEKAALHYEKLLPSTVDLVILGLGDDGHIASLFPNGAWKNFPNRRVICTGASTIKHPRLSITEKVLKSAGLIVVLASGENKGRVIADLNKNEDIFDIPARMAIKGTWILDKSAYNAAKIKK